jgi:hypothetical protein
VAALCGSFPKKTLHLLASIVDDYSRTAKGRDNKASEGVSAMAILNGGIMRVSNSGLAAIALASCAFPAVLATAALGNFDKGKLLHAGRVGTGFSNKVAADLFRRLDEMSIPKSPFARKLAAEDARR